MAEGMGQKPVGVDAAVRLAGTASVISTLAAIEGPWLVTVRVYVIWPAASTVAGPVLVIERSAWAETTVARVEVLSSGSGSSVSLVTDAVLVTTPEGGAVPVRVAVKVA